MIKYIFYFLHLLFIFISFFLVFFYWQVLILHFLTILSWYFNNNECIITRLEDKMFDETVIDVNKIAFEKGFVNKGDFLINLAAMPIVDKGMVNTLRVNQV